MSVDQLSNHVSMNSFLVCLCAGSMLFSIVAELLYTYMRSNIDFTPRRSHRWCLLIGFLLSFSSIFNQLASALACRSVEVLEDIQFMSMILVQLGGFFVCLIYAYVLGARGTFLSTT